MIIQAFLMHETNEKLLIFSFRTEFYLLSCISLATASLKSYVSEMLKWTVSRPLSTSSSTPHGVQPPNRPRRPFVDLSNTPPTGRAGVQGQVAGIRSTPARRRRCRSHGSDLRTYFQTTKPNLRSAKRQSMSRAAKNNENFESFYQSTPRVDADIGPLTLCPDMLGPRRNVAATLPADPNFLAANVATNSELPQNLMNEAGANLQSHVSDFFQQISHAASPEDMMEADPVVPLCKSRVYSQNCDIRKAKFSVDFCRTPNIPKLAKIAKLHNRCRTPYHSKAPGPKSKEPQTVGQTPLINRLTHLKLDHDLARFENVDNTVTEVLHGEKAAVAKSVAEILALDPAERRAVLDNEREVDDNLYETIEPHTNHNDSTVSSASQLLEDPSPMSWATGSSPGEFTLRRQRGIRRKRTGHQRDHQEQDSGVFRKRAKRRSASLSPKKSPSFREGSPPHEICEAINLEVNKLALETDLDASCQMKVESFCPSFDDPMTEEHSRKTLTWDLDSPKSSMNDDFHSSKSFLTSVSVTPEAPLVATVRRCLKYSPEGDAERIPYSRGSIEVELSSHDDHIRVCGKFDSSSYKVYKR